MISEEGIATTDLNSIKLVAPLYYEKLFNQDTYWIPEVIVKRKLILEASYWLSRDVTYSEIKTAMFQTHPDKAPGPDGYWELVGANVCKAVHYFFTTGRLLTEVNHTFVTLVPKSSNASHLNDFRPISCCNTLYKVISKVLSNRLQHVIGELISPNQCAMCIFERKAN